MEIEKGVLYVVGTPIGCLDDLTVRALFVLKGVDCIACEDTRTASKLLNRYEVKVPLIAYHEHNELMQVSPLIEKLRSGESIALISDAGIPTISDPGFRIIRECRKQMIDVIPIPGASAVMTALSVSGLPTDCFSFFGFLPPKASARKTFFERHRNDQETLVLYESCLRIEKFLNDLIAVLGEERTIFIGREMTKMHETYLAGSVKDVRERLLSRSKKGEFVVLIAKEDFAL